MNPAEIIQAAMTEGVDISLSPGGKIKVTGEQSAVTHWLSILRENKAEIVNHLVNLSAGSTAPSLSWSRARSYPCGKCGNQIYREILAGWLCENCGAMFPFIGGTRGPEIIH